MKRGRAEKIAVVAAVIAVRKKPVEEDVKELHSTESVSARWVAAIHQWIGNLKKNEG